jgi:hypothetical protein
MRSRSLVTAAVVAFGLLGPAVSQAFAVSVRDLVSLSREGVSDPVLVALIETDGSKFTLNADDIRSLRYQGLSDTIILAMIRTSKVRLAPEPDAPVPAEPAIETISTPQPAPIIVVNQNVVQKVDVQAPRRGVDYSQPVYVPIYVAVPAKPVETKKAEPIYWGWGGQRRPDAWKEPVIIK